MNWWRKAHELRITATRNRVPRRFQVKTSKPTFLLVLAAALIALNMATPLRSTAETSSSQWSVQVVEVDAGDVNLEPAFQVAIYENLVDQLNKSKRFKQVLRDGDRSASGVPDL